MQVIKAHFYLKRNEVMKTCTMWETPPVESCDANPPAGADATAAAAGANVPDEHKAVEVAVWPPLTVTKKTKSKSTISKKLKRWMGSTPKQPHNDAAAASAVSTAQHSQKDEAIKPELAKPQAAVVSPLLAELTVELRKVEEAGLPDLGQEEQDSGVHEDD